MSKLACFYQTRPLTQAEQKAAERTAKREKREEQNGSANAVGLSTKAR
jgi:hypothetical protein